MIKTLFSIMSILLLCLNARADKVPLPQFQELVAIQIEKLINESKNIQEVYKKSGYTPILKQDKEYFDNLEQGKLTKANLPKVTRSGRVLNFKFEEATVNIEIIDALTQRYKINDYEVDLLNHPTMSQKHKYLEKVLSMKGKSKSAMMLLLGFSNAHAGFDFPTLGVVGVGGGAAAVVCTIVTVGMCGLGAVVGVSLLAGGAWAYCKVHNSGPCATVEGKIGGLATDIGLSIEKLVNSNKTWIKFSCEPASVALYNISEVDMTNVKNLSDITGLESYRVQPTKEIISSVKECCSKNKKMCEAASESYFKARNDRKNLTSNQEQFIFESGSGTK